jgi:DNA invertase Pin-like site-specific DNA recombinase
MATTYLYTRVSTDEQTAAGNGLAAQRDTLTAEIARRGWDDAQWITDEGVSGGVDPAARPALGPVMARLRRGDVLASAKLDRLSRSVGDLAGILDRSRREGWQLVLVDLGIDTSSPVGEAMASVAGVFAQLERRMIGLRTKEALAAKKARGARLGRPRVLDPAVQALVVDLRATGLSLRAIGAALIERGYRPPGGGVEWQASTVAGILRSAHLDAEAAANRGEVADPEPSDPDPEPSDPEPSGENPARGPAVRTPWGARILEQLADGQWHNRWTVVVHASSSVPHGRAWRRNQAERKHPTDPDHAQAYAHADAGAVSIVSDTLGGLCRRGHVETRGTGKDKMIRLRPRGDA